MPNKKITFINSAYVLVKSVMEVARPAFASLVSISSRSRAWTGLDLEGFYMHKACNFGSVHVKNWLTVHVKICVFQPILRRN